jgi:transposase
MPSNDAQFKEIVTDMLDECCRAGTNSSPGFAATAGGIRDVTPSALGCEECLKMARGGCICASAGLAAMSAAPNRHATKHFHKTRHPIIEGYDPPEGLDDLQWSSIKGFLPGRKRRGPRRVDDRRVISGIIHVLQSGMRWRDCPKEYGPSTTIYNRWHRRSQQGLLVTLYLVHQIRLALVSITSARFPKMIALRLGERMRQRLASFIRAATAFSTAGRARPDRYSALMRSRISPFSGKRVTSRDMTPRSAAMS